MININDSLNFINPLKIIKSFVDASTFNWTAAASLAGSYIQSKSAKKAAAAQQAAAASAAEGAAFNPYNVSGAFGQGTFTQGEDGDPNSASFQLSPQMQQMQDMFGAQATQFAGQGQTGIGQQATDLSAGFFGQAQVDPNVMAQSQFAKMQDILAPSRSRSREALESRLLQQGRLGSTGGALSEQAQQEAFGQQDQRLLFDAMAQGQQVQSQQLAQGQQLGLFGQQQQDVGFNQAQARLGAMSGIEQQGLNYLELGAGFGGQGAAAGATQGRFNMQGASAGSAALLGGAAGQAAAFGQVGNALSNYNWGGGNSGANNGVYTQGDAYQDVYDFGFDAGD